MDSAKFKKLIILWWILGVALITVSIISHRYLPDELLVYFERISRNEPLLFDWVMLGVAFGLFIGVIAASIGIYKQKLWARKLFLWAHILSVAVTPAYGPLVMSEWTAAICYSYMMLSGGIIFLAYAAPMSLSFD